MAQGGGRERGREEEEEGRDGRCASVKPVGTLIREIKFSNETHSLTRLLARSAFFVRAGDAMNSQDDPSPAAKRRGPARTVRTVTSKESVIVPRFPAELSADNMRLRARSPTRKIHIYVESCSCERDGANANAKLEVLFVKRAVAM